MTIARRTQETCTCKAYHFPHRSKSGHCHAKRHGPYCGECGEPAEPIRADFGYGALEAWGQRFTHTDVRTVSRCCEADLFDDASLTEPYPHEED